MNTRNIKIDTISKTITFEKSVTSAEIRLLISDLYNYSIVIQEPVKEEAKTASEILELLRDKNKPSEFTEPFRMNEIPYNPLRQSPPNINPPFNPTCTSPCFCSGKCKTGWSGNKSDMFRWNLNGR